MFKELVHKVDLGNGYYMNPILMEIMQRSAVFGKEKRIIRRTVSTGQYRPGLSIFESKDLVNWRLLAIPF